MKTVVQRSVPVEPWGVVWYVREVWRGVCVGCWCRVWPTSRARGISSPRSARSGRRSTAASPRHLAAGSETPGSASHPQNAPTNKNVKTSVIFFILLVSKQEWDASFALPGYTVPKIQVWCYTCQSALPIDQIPKSKLTNDVHIGVLSSFFKQFQFFSFFKVFLLGTFTCSILGPLVPLFWISSDVSSGFQS